MSRVKATVDAHSLRNSEPRLSPKASKPTKHNNGTEAFEPGEFPINALSDVMRQIAQEAANVYQLPIEMSALTVLGVVTAVGALPAMYYSKGLLALDHTDFWCNLMMIVAATFQVIIFGWVIGAEKGVAEMNRGADVRVPKAFAFMIRYVTPTFLIVILGAWSYNNLPGYLKQMTPDAQGDAASRAVYAATVNDHFAEAGLPAEGRADARRAGS